MILRQSFDIHMVLCIYIPAVHACLQGQGSRFTMYSILVVATVIPPTLTEIRTFRQIWKAAARCALFPIAAKHHRSAFPSHHGCLPPSHLSHSTTWDEGCKLKAQKNHQQMVIMVNKILKRASKSERESYGRQKMEEGEDIARTSQAL